MSEETLTDPTTEIVEIVETGDSLDNEITFSESEINQIRIEGERKAKLHQRLNARKASKFEMLANFVLEGVKSKDQIEEDHRKKRLQARLKARSTGKMPTYAEAVAEEAASKITCWLRRCLERKRKKA